MTAYTVALTGGIASGKTRVAECFARLGVPVLDADRIARQVVEPGQPCLEQIRDYFGDEVIASDGHLNRRHLRQLIFSHPPLRAKLDALMHPVIYQELLAQADQLQSPYGLLVVPLLIETRQTAIADRVLVVDVPEAVQIERLMARDGHSAEMACRMVAAQASRAQRLQAADEIIDNGGGAEMLEAQIAPLHQQYLKLAQDQGT